ncbi:hypothetical protein B0I37DRAFT_442419 [Chaetomium sp. MPI-CAGE-AT-0009]|nr:hypothetical protein B0I37DRAFT_442419 [Chaetomium sp. MPI-CAGE-AT-0009]
MPMSLPETNEPIAVIGSGCRFPGGASSPSKLWKLLSEPRDVLKEMPRSRFDPHGFYNEDAEYHGHSNVRHSYVLDEDHRLWDADFFSVSANEASAIDPQQRLLMECVYEALEAGGQRMQDLRGSDTAVYVGLMCEEYSDIQGRELNTIPRYFPTGTARSIVANRVSYFFDWRGASMTIDTACSSSLVAVHQAVQVLRSGASRVAVAAGTNLLLGPEPYIAESTFHMLSPQGRSHMWDAGADGYGRGDGVAAVVLKKLSTAIADGDDIECIIRETGVNQDGRTNGITVPSADSQVALIQDTYRRAGLDLSSASGRPQFFEAHGTGTLAGDPIEAEAIHRAIGRDLAGQAAPAPLYVGSIKSVIGHTEGTAGLAGLLKASLAVQNGIVPPNLLFRKLNPAIEPFYRGLEVPVQAKPWPDTPGQPRRASVNSFGFGGTNAHAIVESYQPPAARDSLVSNRGYQTHNADNYDDDDDGDKAQACRAVPYTFSAGSKGSLKRLLKKVAEHLQQRPDTNMHDLAFTLNTRRSNFPFRISFVGDDAADVAGKIHAAVDSGDWDTDAGGVQRAPPAGSKPSRILGIFTGQGAQWAGMGRELVQDVPLARARLLQLERVLEALPAADRPNWSLTAELLESDPAKSRLHLAEFAQPLCTALQIVLVDLLGAAGVRFSDVVGHSSGEIAAAYAVGVLSARDAMVVAYYRGHFSGLARGPGGKKGAMLAVGTTLEDANEIVSLPQFEGRLGVAAHNSPTSVTLSGDADAVEEAQTMFQDEGKFTRPLRVDTAYHSHHMQPCTGPYVDALRRASVHASRIRDGARWFSSVNEGVINTGKPREELDGAYWARNMAQTVLFSSAVKQAVLADSANANGNANANANAYATVQVIEVGPHAALRGPVTDTITEAGRQAQAYISCLARGANSSHQFGSALGQIWAHAPEPVKSVIDLDQYQQQQAVHSGEQQQQYRTRNRTKTRSRRRVLKDLPTYAWDNQRVFWHESRRSRALRERTRPGHPLLGTVIPDSTATDIIWHNVLRVSDLPWLDGHQLQGQTVFPAAAYVALAVEAALHVAVEGPGILGISDDNAGDSGNGADGWTATRIELKDMVIGRAIAFEDEKTGIETLFSLAIEHDNSNRNLGQNGAERIVVAQFRSRSVPSDGSTEAVLNASGTIVLTLAPKIEEASDQAGGAADEPLLPMQEPAPALLVDVDDKEFYSALQDLGYQYSMSFRALGSMRRKMSYGRGRVAVPARPTLHRSEKGLLVHPGLLDASFQAIFLAYSWPGDGRLWSLHVPVSIRSVQIDVAAARASADDSSLQFDSVITADGSVTGEPGIAGDVNVFTGDGRRGVIQVEGIRVIPFAAAAESQDAQMFFTNVSGVAFPDGELAMQRAPGFSSRAPKDEIELGWLLERISHFYLARLAREIRPDEEARAEWHHQKLMDFARHTVAEVSSGRQPYGKREWTADVDNPASIMQAMDAAQDDYIEVRLMRSVGEHLAEAVRGQTVILQHMLKDGMLNQYYVESLGLRPYTAFLSEVIGQLTHVNPRMRILEIGAGTGGATKSIFKRVGPAGFEQYTFTDISSGFFETAQGVFSQLLAPSAFSRMSFKVLDAEKDVLGQGFTEGSYDLVIASLVLHATRDLEHTLRNVRKLLRPGGYLVMLEVTSNVTMRLSFTMGGLEGWWLGAEAGRPWTPCVSSAEWHSLLLQSGFTGVEASTPELDTLPRPFGVLISRATDERFNTIISPAAEPSPLSTIPDEFFIITGASLRSLRAAQSITRVLRPHCDLPITTVTRLETLPEALEGVSNRLTVLYLGDLDGRPVFESLSTEAFEGLKALFARVQTLLWVTSGAARDRPHANMALGLLRAMAMEHSHIRMQFIDYAVGTPLDPYTVADDLLRLRILADLEQQQQSEEILWTREPEIKVDETGRRWVARIMPHTRFNDSYNSSRRVITAPADSSRDRVEVHGDWQGQPALVRVQGGDDDSRSPDASSTVELRALYSAPLSSGVYLTLGEKRGTNELAIALGNSLASVLRAEATSLVPYSGSSPEAPSRLRAIANQLIALILAAEAATGTALLLVEPDEDVAALVSRWSTENQAHVTFVTSSSAKKRSGSRHPFVYIHPRATKSSIRSSLLQLKSQATTIINVQGDKSSHLELASRIRDALGLPGPLKSFEALAKELKNAQVMLEDAINRTSNPAGAYGEKENAISIQDYVKEQGRAGRVIDWTDAHAIPLRVKPSDALPLMRGDRTYLLVGLAGRGGLGLSLAEYLVRQGARYIVLTSRNPSVDESLTQAHAANGVRIEAFANDVTNEASLRELVAELRRPGSSWPPIAGVANGAMVLNDVTLQNMTHEQMTKVLRPKVEGTRALDDVFYDDPLDFFVLFSSLSCVFGREGQANYDAANMYLVGLAAQRRARGVSASVVDIGAIMGTGYMAREVSERTLAQLLGAGYRKMSERDFHIAFANAVITGRARSDQPEELITGLYVAAPGEEFNPAWAHNARFAHVLTRAGAGDGESTAASAQLESTQELLKRARTGRDVVRVIQAAVLNKLKNMLQLSNEMVSDQDSLLQQGTGALGVDSLVAVEIRSWMLRDLDVDIPVLKILSDATIQDMVDFAVANLPDTLTPNLDPSSNEDAITLDSISKPAAQATTPSPPKEQSSITPAPVVEPTQSPPEKAVRQPPEAQTRYPPQPSTTSSVYGAEQTPVVTKWEQLNTIPASPAASSTSSDSFVQVAKSPSSRPVMLTPDSSSSTTTPFNGTRKQTEAVALPPYDLPPQSSLSTSSRVLERQLPMSYGQSRFWLMSHIVPDPSAFNVTCDIEITGTAVDAATLSKAVVALGSRHEALRTCFFNDTESGTHEPVQGVLMESPLRLETATANSATEVERKYKELHGTVYNLEKGELIRIVLVTLSKTQHHLLVGYHHINMDSSSLAVLVMDLSRLYAAQKQGSLPPPAPRLQQPDFALWQLKQVRDGKWDRQIAYWKRELTNPPVPTLPRLNISPSADKPRPERIAYRVLSTKTRVTARVAAHVRGLCRRARATPFHLYATVLQILLARLGDTDDLCIGMADAGRAEAGALDSVGNFLNMVPLRLKTALDQPFEALLRATKEKVLGAMSNASVPFDVILEQVQPHRSPSHSPLFQAFIDYRQVTEKLPWGEAGGQLEGKRYLLSKTPYDVMLDIIDTPTGEASLELTVQDGLYTAADAERLLGAYVNLLGVFAGNGRAVARDAAMFGAHEVEHALRLGQGELLPLEHDTILPDLESIATSQPTATALQDSTGGHLSWSDMMSRVTAIARTLQGLGLPSHSNIGVFQDPTVDWICSMLGTWQAGHVYVPLEPSQGLSRLADIATGPARVSGIVVHDATASLVSQLGLSGSVPVVNVSKLANSRRSEASRRADERFPSVSLEDVAMVIHTSGSTGVPKGISIPHRVVVNAVKGIIHRWPELASQPQAILQQIAISFDMSWWTALLGLATRGRVVVAARDARGDPQALTSLILSSRITITVAVPTEAAAWLQEAGEDRLRSLRSSEWRWHIAAGEPFSLGLVKHLQALNKPGLRALNVYGPTETMIPTAHEVTYATMSETDMPVPIGRIMPNYCARVVNPDGQPVPAGVPGHLVFSGAGIAHGYLANPTLTSERFPRDDLAGPVSLAHGWRNMHLSGDRGYVRPSDGVFMLLGRIGGDNQVKLRGLRIELADIETNLVSTSEGQISSAAVHLRKPVESDPASHFLAAHVVLSTRESRFTARTETAQLNAFLRKLVKDLPLPNYMRPSAIFAVSSLPLSHHGKLDRKAVAALPLAHQIATAPSSTAPHLGTQTHHVASSEASDDSLVQVDAPLITNPVDSVPPLEMMKQLWLSILREQAGAEPLSEDSDFFLAGGNSMLLIRVQSEIRSRFGREVPLAELFQRSTLAQMASILDANNATIELGATPPPAPAFDWAEEIKPQPELAGLRLSPRPNPTGGLVVALTGATGFLGREILERLLDSPQVTTVHAVAVRSPGLLADISSPKLAIHVGDLSRPDLGLTPASLHTIFSTTDTIIHNGADTSFLKAYTSLRPTNVTSTRDIVRHALHHNRLRHLHYISTAGISTLLGRDIYEAPLDTLPPPHITNEGYILSKWVSELYLEQVSAQTGLAVSIHRPTSVVGQGAPPLDVMANVLRFSEELRAVPEMAALEGSFQFVHVDECAGDVVAAVLDGDHGDGDAGVGRPASAGGGGGRLVRYFNHSGQLDDAVDVHGFGEYLGRKLGTGGGLPVLPDAEWIAKAEAEGMAAEVARYLEGMNLADRNGQKWLFPTVWKGGRVGTVRD